MQDTANMILRSWNLGSDNWDFAALANNWSKIDLHDHSPDKGVPIPREGIQNQAIDTSKLANLAVDTAQLADDAVTADKLDELAVATGHLQDASVTAAKLGADTLNTFLRLLTPGTRRLTWGTSGSFPGFNAVTDESAVTVNHGLPGTPVAAFAIQAPGTHYSSGVRIACSIGGWTSTQLTISGTCTRQPIAPTVTANAYWFAIG